MVGASLLYTVDVAAHQGDNIEAARLRLQAAGATGCGLSTITHGSGGRAKLTQLWLDNRLLHKEDLLKYLRELAASSTPSTCLHLLQQLVQEGVCSWEVLQDVYPDPEQLGQVLHTAGLQQHLQHLLQAQHNVSAPPPTGSPPGAYGSPFATVVLQLLLDGPSTSTQHHGATLPWLEAPAAWSSFVQRVLRTLHQQAQQDGVLLLELVRVVGERVMPLAPEVAAWWFQQQLGALLQPQRAPSTPTHPHTAGKPLPASSSVLLDPQVCAGFMGHALRCCGLPQLWQQHLGGFLATAGCQGPPQLLVAATVLVVMLRSSSVMEEAVLTQVAGSLWHALQLQEPQQLVAWLLLLRRCLPVDRYSNLVRDSCSKRIQQLGSGGAAAAAAADLLVAALDAATPGAPAEVLRVHQQLAQDLRLHASSHHLLDKLQQLQDLLKVALAEQQLKQAALQAAVGGMPAGAPTTHAGTPAASADELQRYLEQYQHHMRQGLPALPGPFYMFRPHFARLQPLLLQPPPDAAAAQLRGDFIQALVTCKQPFLPQAVWQEYQQVCWALGLPTSSKERAEAVPLLPRGPAAAAMVANGDTQLAALLDRLGTAAASQSAAAVRVLLSRLGERLQVLLKRISSTIDIGPPESNAQGPSKRRKLSLHAARPQPAAGTHAAAAGTAGAARTGGGSGAATASGGSQVSAGTLVHQLLDGWVQLFEQTAAAGGTVLGSSIGAASSSSSTSAWQHGFLMVLAGATQLHRHLSLDLLQRMRQAYKQDRTAGFAEAKGQTAIPQLLSLMASCVGVEQPVAGSEAVHQVLQPQYCWAVPPVLYSVSAGAATTYAGGMQQQRLVVVEATTPGASAYAVAGVCQLHQGSAIAARHSMAPQWATSPVQQALQQAHVDIMRQWVQQLGATAVQVEAGAGAAPCCCEAGMPGWQLVQLLRAAAADG